MTRGEKQLKRKLEIIDEAEKALTKGLTETQREVYNAIIKDLEKFTSESGKLQYDRDAIKIINELEKKIYSALKKTTYRESVLDYLQNFDLIREQNLKIQKSVNNLTVKDIGLTSLQKSARELTVNSLLGNGLATNFVQPVKDQIFNHVVSGSSIADTELALRELIMGNREKYGRFERYVIQTSRDSITQYDGMIQSRIAQEYKLDGFSYEGSLIKDSRKQCVRWVEKFNGILKKEDLEQEIQWAYDNGSGMIPNTTVETFPVYRGGFSCRHSCTAIRIT